jgi:hypothetical protein
VVYCRVCLPQQYVLHILKKALGRSPIISLLFIVWQKVMKRERDEEIQAVAFSELPSSRREESDK